MLFQTHMAALRLSALNEAARVVLGELRRLRMTGLATAVLESLKQDPSVERVEVGISEQALPSLASLFAPTEDFGQQRVLHYSVRVFPEDRFIELPGGLVAAAVTGEGTYCLERDSDFARRVLARFADEPELAAQELAAAMDRQFLPVVNEADANAVS